MNKNLSEIELDGMLYVYYLNKLNEFKLIEGNVPKLTLKGFELAHELYENGRTLSQDIIIKYTDAILKDADDEFKDAIIEFIKHIQELGFDEMKKEIQNLKDS